MPRKTTRRADIRNVARAAYADTASVSTSVNMLMDVQGEVTVDDELRKKIVAGIVSKCQTACAHLWSIEEFLGGEPK